MSRLLLRGTGLHFSKKSRVYSKLSPREVRKQVLSLEFFGESLVGH